MGNLCCDVFVCACACFAKPHVCLCDALCDWEHLGVEVVLYERLGAELISMSGCL